MSLIVAMPEEFDREDHIQKIGVGMLLKKYGNNIWHFRTSEKRIKDVRGIPDDIFCFFGIFVGVEFKNGNTPKKPHEALQKYNIMKIRQAKGFAFVCRSIPELMQAFEEIYIAVIKKT